MLMKLIAYSVIPVCGLALLGMIAFAILRNLGWPTFKHDDR
jgi:hypothetical protein